MNNLAKIGKNEWRSEKIKFFNSKRKNASGTFR